MSNEMNEELDKKSEREPKKIKKTSTRFADFIRYASPAEKERVYAEVMRKATELQDNLLKKSS